MRKILTVLFICYCLAGAGAQERPSVALVLGGGGARGFAHIAVLELIEELGIPIDMITGVSSGAIVGGLYAAGYSPSMILEAMDGMDWTSLFRDRPVSPFWNSSEELSLSFKLGSSGFSGGYGAWGFSSGQRVYELFKSLTVKIPSNIDFDTLPIPFRAGVVEVPGGRFDLLRGGDLAEAIRASMSIPSVFVPIDIEGKSYTDGGVTNVLPVRDVKEMGYDIVIAVDLFAPPAQLDISPASLPDLLNSLYNNNMSREHHAYADVVLFPLPSDVSFMDFAGGNTIYALAKAEHDRFASLLEPIRERTGAGSAHVSGNYREMPSLGAQKIVTEGALKRDLSYIERMFSRYIMGKELEAENISAFLEKIYETGNYRMARVRIEAHGGENCLVLILFPGTENKFLVRAGLDYEGTFSYQSSSRATLRSGLEYFGRNGSSIFFKAGVLNEFSLGLSLFHPVNPHFFISAETDLVRDQELMVTGILSTKEIEPRRLMYFRGELKGGLRINMYNSFSFRPEYFWLKDENSSYSMTGMGAAYTYSGLNYSLFPSRGFRLRLENRFRYNIYGQRLFDIVSADLTGAIGLGKYFSIIATGFGSSLFGLPDMPAGISTFDLERIHRIQFPHAYGIFTGEKRAALSLALQFEPREHLSIVGGRLIFSLAGAAGRASSSDWKEWANFGREGLIWNASFGTALVFLESIGFQLRAGAGGGDGHRPAPFVSLDAGMYRFQKRLF